MSNHSSAQSLAATLAEKREQDRKQIEALTRSELEQLAESLKRQSSAALGSTLNAIESELSERLNGIRLRIEQQSMPLESSLKAFRGETAALQALALKSWIKPVATSLSLLLGIFCGSWALTLWFSSGIRDQLETRADLAQQIRGQQDTLAKIEARTWGVTFLEDNDGRFLILPPGMKPATGWTVGKRNAVKLGKK
jgi:hypothetical protein